MLKIAPAPDAITWELRGKPLISSIEEDCKDLAPCSAIWLPSHVQLAHLKIHIPKATLPALDNETVIQIIVRSGGSIAQREVPLSAQDDGSRIAMFSPQRWRSHGER